MRSGFIVNHFYHELGDVFNKMFHFWNVFGMIQEVNVSAGPSLQLTVVLSKRKAWKKLAHGRTYPSKYVFSVVKGYHKELYIFLNLTKYYSCLKLTN